MPPKVSRFSKGRSGYKSKSATKRKYRQQKLSVATVQKIAKKAVMKVSETKQHLVNFPRASLYHNGGSLGVAGAQFNFTNNLPNNGSGESERLGCEIYPRGIRVTMTITLPYDRLNTSLRIMVLSCPKGYNPLTQYDYLFDSVSNNVMTDPIDTDRVKKIKTMYINASKMFMFNPNIPTGTNKEVTIFRKLWIPFTNKIQFLEQSQTTTSLSRDIIMVAHAFDSWGTLASDIVAYIKVDSKLYFKDP